MEYNRRRLFVASCLALVTNAVAFSVCTDIMGDFERVFHLSKAEVGAAVSWGALGGCLVQFVGGAVLDFVGIGRMFWLAFVTHTVGLGLVIGAQGFWSLTAGWFVLSIAGNIVEATVNPLAATMYPEKKISIMNVLHAWWPGGLIIGGLLAFGFSHLLDATGASETVKANSWQIKMGFALVPTLLYAVLISGQRFPQTERAQAGVPASQMLREALRPLFLVLVFCMFLTASTELAPNRWVGVFIQDIVGIRGILFLVYTSGLMFVLRLFAGKVTHTLSPMGILIASSVISAVGLLALSYTSSMAGVLVAATIFGIGVTYYWPTMLGLTAERFPKGGAFLLGIIGASGGLFISYVTIPGMGLLHDHYTLNALPAEVRAEVVDKEKGLIDDKKVEVSDGNVKTSVNQARSHAAKVTFRWVAVIPAALVLIFGLIALAGGGKKEDGGGRGREEGGRTEAGEGRKEGDAG
jgi:MFS family permease